MNKRVSASGQKKATSPMKKLGAIADIVLAYKPKPKSKPAKRRKRHAAKIAREDQS